MTSLPLLDKVRFTHTNLISLSYLLAEQWYILLPKQKHREAHLDFSLGNNPGSLPSRIFLIILILQGTGIQYFWRKDLKKRLCLGQQWKHKQSCWQQPNAFWQVCSPAWAQQFPHVTSVTPGESVPLSFQFKPSPYRHLKELKNPTAVTKKKKLRHSDTVI